jgi:hypothetical protein
VKALAITSNPCAKCPFRKDVPIYLRLAGRREIARSLVNGETFYCHGAVDYSDESGEGDTTNSVECAGAAKAMLAMGATTQSMRIAERLGLADLDATAERGAEVWALATWQELAEGATADSPEWDDDEIETCNTVNETCIAPAGYGGFNGGVAIGTKAADCECSECGEPVCSECISATGLCGMCAEWGAEA